MALPSQQSRTITLGRTYMSRRRRRHPVAVLAGGAAALVLVVILGAWAFSGGPEDAHAEAASGERAEARVGTPLRIAARSPGVPNEPVRTAAPPPAPVEVRMGGTTTTTPSSASSTVPGTAAGRAEPPPARPERRDAEPAPTTTAAAPSEPIPAMLPPATGASAESSLPADLRSLLSAGRRALSAGEALKGRELLNAALRDPRLPEPERATVRSELAAINEELIFSPRPVSGDPFITVYAVQPGDSLAKIAARQDLATDWRLIQRVNGLANPNRIQVGQKLKLVKGPFHAIVHKGAYRLDLYMGPAESPDSWIYVRSFAVGLGEGNSTPTGDFVVKKGSKLVNPFWVNPRTRERFAADDPDNPIGERWIGLEGLGESAPHTGYGLHGTIDPDSIGKQKSMGCVRLGDRDIELIYELLTEGVSLVQIRP